MGTEKLSVIIVFQYKRLSQNLFFETVPLLISILKIRNIFFNYGEHTDFVRGMRRQLPKVMGAICVSFNNCGAVFGKRNIPAYITNFTWVSGCSV